MSDKSSADKAPNQSLPIERATPQTAPLPDNTPSAVSNPAGGEAVSGGNARLSAESQPDKPSVDASGDKTVWHAAPVVTDEKIAALPAVSLPDKPPAIAAQPAPAESQVDKATPSPSPDDTLPRKPSTSTGVQKIAVAPIIPPVVEPLSDLENPYILSGEVDRARLVAQTKLFRGYIENNAKRLVGEKLTAILDVGCGEGQLTLSFAKLYPAARIIGIDRDEKAIEVARRAAKGLPNLEFLVGDIQESLPKGPFDLVYASVVLMHVPNTAKVLQLIYEALKPEGYFWSKDHHSSMATAVDHPAFKRLGDWMGATVDRIGGHWRIGAELADILSAKGFTNVRTEKETYTLGNKSSEERITMSINLGALYNSRKLTNRILGVPESEVEKAYKEVLDAMMAPDGPRGDFLYMNTIAQRPVQTA